MLESPRCSVTARVAEYKQLPLARRVENTNRKRRTEAAKYPYSQLPEVIS